MSESELHSKINSLPWFRQIELKPSLFTPSPSKCVQLLSVYNIYIKDDLLNKTVLNIGSYDGFMSFMAAKEAKSIAANDYFFGNIMMEPVNILI